MVSSSCLRFNAKLSESLFKNRIPKIYSLNSDASILPRRMSAALNRCDSNCDIVSLGIACSSILRSRPSYGVILLLSLSNTDINPFYRGSSVICQALQNYIFALLGYSLFFTIVDKQNHVLIIIERHGIFYCRLHNGVLFVHSNRCCNIRPIFARNIIVQFIRDSNCILGQSTLWGMIYTTLLQIIIKIPVDTILVAIIPKVMPLQFICSNVSRLPGKKAYVFQPVRIMFHARKSSENRPWRQKFCRKSIGFRFQHLFTANRQSRLNRCTFKFSKMPQNNMTDFMSKCEPHTRQISNSIIVDNQIVRSTAPNCSFRI
nr:MAG TPA: hypothetical protein [Caudoviricetes sp.]